MERKLPLHSLICVTEAMFNPVVNAYQFRWIFPTLQSAPPSSWYNGHLIRVIMRILVGYGQYIIYGRAYCQINDARYNLRTKRFPQVKNLRDILPIRVVPRLGCRYKLSSSYSSNRHTDKLLLPLLRMCN